MKFPENNQFYTGWSSSSVLQRKNLIEMWGNPKKIRLTDAGVALASKIEGEKKNETFEDASWLKDVSEDPDPLVYCYVTDDDLETDDQDRAEVDIDVSGVQYLIKCKEQSLKSSGKVFKVKDRMENGFITAFLKEADCLSKSPGKNFFTLWSELLWESATTQNPTFSLTSVFLASHKF